MSTGHGPTGTVKLDGGGEIHVSQWWAPNTSGVALEGQTHDDAPFTLILEDAEALRLVALVCRSCIALDDIAGLLADLGGRSDAQ
jgi:hypothetical protein